MLALVPVVVSVNDSVDKMILVVVVVAPTGVTVTTGTIWQTAKAAVAVAQLAKSLTYPAWS